MKQTINRITKTHYEAALNYIDPSGGRGRLLKQRLKMAIMDGYCLGLEKADKLIAASKKV